MNVDDDAPAGEGWVEITRLEALKRIETQLTIDLVAFEIERTEDVTPIGNVETYTWFLLDDTGGQQPTLLSLRDPSRGDVRWFVHPSLVDST